MARLAADHISFAKSLFFQTPPKAVACQNYYCNSFTLGSMEVRGTLRPHYSCLCSFASNNIRNSFNYPLHNAVSFRRPYPTSPPWIYKCFFILRLNVSDSV
jgi:hypothetical protein